MAAAVPLPVPGSWRAAALALAGAGICAAVLLGHLASPLWAAGICAGIAAVAALGGQAAAMAPLLPVLALLPMPRDELSWYALAALTVLGCLLPLGILRRQRAAAAAATARPAPPAQPVAPIPPADPSPPRTPATTEPEDYDELAGMRHECEVLEAHLARYPRLLEACMELAAAREPDQLASTLIDETRELIPGVVSAQVFIGTGKKMENRASWAAEGEPMAEAPGAAAHYVLTEFRSLVRRQGNRVQAVYPLRSERRARGMELGHRGVLVVNFTSRGSEDQLLLDLLAALSRIGGLGLASADLLAEARSLALHDDLTGLFGRHEFLRRLQEQVATARREDHGLAVIMCDMDHLKRFNDRFGHQAGDEALRLVAAAIRSQLPDGAGACRFGGEEFAVFVPGAGGQTAQVMADKILQAIRESANDSERRVTASIGWAVLHDSETSEAILERADQACYRAKDGGRDRVEAGN